MRPRNGARWSSSPASRWIELRVEMVALVMPVAAWRCVRYQPSVVPALSRDLYAAAIVLKKASRWLSFNYSPLWLWVPACAGTTAWRGSSDTPSPPRGAITPELRNLPSAVEGAGNAGCSGSPAASRAEKKAHELVTAGSPDAPGIPRTSGFNGFLRDLPGDRLYCHRRRCDALASSPA